MIISILEQGIIFGILALGVYITYKILDFPDLTVDGSIVLGASITAILITKDVNPFLATLIAILGGVLAGLFTGVLHVHLKLSNLLSGILVGISLYSINLRIMGRPNLPFFQKKNIFSYVNLTKDFDKLLTLLIIIIIVKLLLDWFLKTQLGTLLRITGDNPQLVTSLGVNLGRMKILGLMMANGLVALSGSLLAQYQRFSDINAGIGTIVIGLAAVIIGESLFKLKFLKTTTQVILGSIVYKAIQAFTLKLGLIATDFKLITALILIVILGLYHWKLDKKVEMQC